MIYWDASAIVPLLIAEAETRRLHALAVRDPDMMVWWGTAVECVSALARRERAALLDAQSATRALDKLNRLSNTWGEVEPTETVRETAVRFLRVHPLRTADALQLAAAFVAAEHRPSSLQLITLDSRLADAARKEGFSVLDVAAR